MDNIEERLCTTIAFESRKRLDVARKEKISKLFCETKFKQDRTAFFLQGEFSNIKIYEKYLELESNNLEDLLKKLRGMEKILNFNARNTDNIININKTVQFNIENDIEIIGKMIGLKDFAVVDIKYIEKISEEVNDYSIYSMVRIASIDNGILVDTKSQFKSIDFIENIYNASKKYANTIIKNSMLKEGD